MTIIFDTTPDTEQIVYTIQMYIPDTDRWCSMSDYKNEWDALETYKEWTECGENIYRIIAVSYTVSIIESEVPEFN